MSEEKVEAIRIIKEIPFFGEGDTLESRLRRVGLRGFPDVKIYELSKFEFIFLRPSEIKTELHTPQPNIFRANLDRVSHLAHLFFDKGIDITDLDRAYDFISVSASGQETIWTMLPPVVERWRIPSMDGAFDYSSLIGERLKDYLVSQGLGLNPELRNLKNTSPSGVFNLINDGAHRIHFGYLNKGIRVLFVSDIVSGYPYYAAPQKYLSVKVVEQDDAVSTAMKIHIVESPGQKSLYRLFPSGGIFSGDVRPPTAGEKFI